MTRRKQNAPQRLASEDDNEGAEAGPEAGSGATNGEPALSEEAGPAGIMETADVDQSQSDSDKMDSDIDQSETNSIKQTLTHDKLDNKNEQNVDELGDSGEIDKALIKSNIDNYSPLHANKNTELDNVSITENDLKIPNNSNEEFDQSKTLKSEKCDLNSPSSKLSNQNSDKENECSEAADENRATRKDGRVEPSKTSRSSIKREPSSKLDKPDKSSSSSTSLFSFAGGSADNDSPMSKLLSMVNNPEKLQRSAPTSKKYTNSFSLAATSAAPKTTPLNKRIPSGALPAPSHSPSSNSLSNSLSTKSSKPLSGFLPPYNIYAHFHSMYANMTKYLDHSMTGMDSSKEQSSPLQAAQRYSKEFPYMTTKRSPSPKSSSSPLSSPVLDPNQEQPLDLSVKTTGLDLSKKANNDDVSNKVDDVTQFTKKFYDEYKERSRYVESADSKKDIKLSDMENSLKSLEEKFGGGVYKTDNSNSSHSKSTKAYNLPFVHPMLPMYGGTLYASALFNTHPWMQSDKLSRSLSTEYSSPRKTPNSIPNPPGTPTSYGNFAKSSSPRVTSSPASSHTNDDTLNSDARTSTPTGKQQNSTTPKLSPSSAASLMVAKMAEKELLFHKKYTNLKCNCKAEFETLYDLTIHVKESGHTPCSRVQEHHEFPKLVRGQDMWLNQGSEQTKQILRCIRCGESFKSLPDLTVHMMKTKHYTNIVGSEATSRKVAPRLAFPNSSPPPPGDGVSSGGGGSSESYRCFDCGEVFVGMEQFSKHLTTSGHHKSPIVIQPMSPAARSSPDTEESLYDVIGSRAALKRLRSSSESSDKDPSVQYRMNTLSKLLDYRDFRLRYEQALRKNGLLDMDDSSLESLSTEENKIRCETCSEKIEMSKFVEHVRQCIKGSPALEHSTPLKKRRLDYDKPELRNSRSLSRDSIMDRISSENLPNGRDDLRSPDATMYQRDAFIQPEDDEDSVKNSTSALKAMETFIERSFNAVKPNRNMSHFGGGSFGVGGGRMHQDYHSNGPEARGNPPLGYPISVSGSYLNGARLESKSPIQSRSPLPSSHSQEPIPDQRDLYSKYLPPLFLDSGTGSKSNEPATSKTEHMDTSTPLKSSIDDIKHFNSRIKTENSSKYVDNKHEIVGQSEGMDLNNSRTEPNEHPVPIKQEVIMDTTRDENKNSSYSVFTNLQHQYRPSTSSPDNNIPSSPTFSQTNTMTERKRSDSQTRECHSPLNEDSTNSVSALASLQGLVYGKSFETKHPLSSLQNLIQRTNSPSSEAQSMDARIRQGYGFNSGNAVRRASSPGYTAAAVGAKSPIPASIASLYPLVPSSTPLVSNAVPLVSSSANALVPGTKREAASPLSVPNAHSTMLKNPLGILATNNNIPSSPKNTSPCPPIPKSEPSPESPTQGSCPSEPRSPSSASENESKPPIKPEVDTNATNGDYRLPICRAPLTERCKEGKVNALSPTKNGGTVGSGGKKKKSSYVYLPLDHSAKFNKYYEMANELASKTK